MSLAQTSFLAGMNADFVAELYARYQENPSAVDPSWADFFGELKDDMRDVLGEIRGASWAPKSATKIVGAKDTEAAPTKDAAKAGKAPAGESAERIRAATLDSIRALMMIRTYRVRGHLLANLDPLGINAPSEHPELDPKHYGFTEADYDRPIFIDGVLGMDSATLRQILDRVRQTYCGSIGVEFMHIQSPEEKSWIQERIESIHNHTPFSREGKRQILQRLIAAEGFERFLQVKFPGTKRFGIEGGEGMIPAIEAIVGHGAELGLKEIVLGMAHRGRLNVLTNVFNKPFVAMFAEFQGQSAYPDSVQGSGDVKYHLGASTDRDFKGNIVHLTMNANPSHLEWVNPVVVGRVRAKQQQRAGQVHVTPESLKQVCGILVHGDAAFAGQGIVAETLMLSELKGYRTGGTIHFVINNQVGFTTSPQYSRSGVYCSDIAKMVQAPILHVNGDDIEAVVHCSRIAMEYRQKFNRDVVVDMLCYRRQGHNESDEPAFTQPLMYNAIKKHPTARELYAKRLVAEGSLTQDEADALQREFLARLEEDFKAAASFKPEKADWLEGKWEGLETAKGEERRGDTGVEFSLLREVGAALSRIPQGFAINPKVAKQLDAKREMIEGGDGIDWATAEALAFGTLVAEGYPVRLSGQDCGRGTFSQRHAVLYDQTNEKRYTPLTQVRNGQASFEVHDSPLSEAAVLGFDYGFSLVEPRALVMWEGQFGDFCNTAQVIIDQFISSAESKWLRMSGLVLLLPHGYEGQGPEHSSGRLERFLQLCAEDNWQVANCTTPANYFHILRRQMHRNFRKPLILMTPKSLLRHKMAVSKLADMGPSTAFHRVIGEISATMVPDDKIRRVVICSGKVYYDLLAAREERKVNDVAIIRMEQFYPFPDKPLATELARYPAAEIVWCQEEPRNMGGWHFVDRRLENVLSPLNVTSKRPRYAGRDDAAATATGNHKRHNQEQAKLIDEALS